MDDLDHVRDLLPEQPGPQDDARERARNRLVGEIRQERKQPSRGRARFGTAFAIAAVTVLLLGTAVLGEFLDGRLGLDLPVTDERPRADAERAAHALRSAAEQLTTDPPGRADESDRPPRTTVTRVARLRVGEHERYTVEWRTLEERRSRTDDGAVRVRVRDLGAAPVSDQDRRAWRRDGSPGVWRVDLGRTELLFGDQQDGENLRDNQIALGDGTLSAADLAELPTRPDRLRARLLDLPPLDRSGGGRWPFADTTHSGSSSRQLFAAAVPLLTELPTTYAVESAAYRMVADLPGLVYHGRVRDELGREGIGVSVGDGSDVLVFDPDSGKALSVIHRTGNEQVAHAETVLGRSTDGPIETSEG